MTFGRELEALLRGPWPALSPMPPTGAEMVIYGAGDCGREVLAVLLGNGFRVVAFLDERAEEIGNVGDLQCVSPRSDVVRQFAQRGMTAIIAVFNFAAEIRPIQSLLQEIGFRRIISFNEFADHFADSIGEHFWLAPRSYYRSLGDQITSTLDLWSDGASRRVFIDALRLRLLYDFDVLRTPDRRHAYCPADLNLPTRGIRLVDGGACVGDTLKLLHEHQYNFEAVACFEPDAQNFNALAQYVREHPNAFGEAVLLPCGLGESTAMRRFSAGKGSGSALSEVGETFVQVAKLDDVLPTFDATFIKLDIEGAEPAALRGAAETIRRSRPNLAVCVYHAPDHLWTLPKLIRELCPGHRLALRYHQFSGFDLVAYAIRCD